MTMSGEWNSTTLFGSDGAAAAEDAVGREAVGREAVGREAVNGFSIVAHALAGRTLRVVSGSGELPYTDTEALYLPHWDDPDALRSAVVVQAGLVAVGALERRCAVRLARTRPATLPRYLVLEVARASNVLSPVLPSRIVERIAQVYDGPVPGSAEESLARAGSREQLPAPPPWFGSVRPIRVLRAKPVASGESPTDRDLKAKSVARQLMCDLDEDDDQGSERSKILELFTAPGMPNPLGSALARLLGMGRSASSDSSGGGERPVGTHRVGPVGGKARTMNAPAGLRAALLGPPVGGVRYPEWDCHRRQYRAQWCSVAEFDPSNDRPAASLDIGSTHRLRLELARVGTKFERRRRQADGDGLDLAALVDFGISRMAGTDGDDRVYERSGRNGRDLAVLVLLDASGSTAEEAEGRKVFSEQRKLAAQLTTVFTDLGDRVAAFGFYSRGREAVRYLRVKGFDDRFDHAAQARLARLEPSGFTRLGAAIRHGTHLLSAGGGTSNLVLVVVGDGLPYDDGYQDRYAREDSRRALREAAARGVGCVGLAVRSSTEQNVIAHVWGEVAHFTLDGASELPGHVRPLFRKALRQAVAVNRPAGGAYQLTRAEPARRGGS